MWYFELPNEKPAPFVSVPEFGSEARPTKSEADLGPEDLAVASKTTSSAELSFGSKLTTDKLETSKQQLSCLATTINSYGKWGLLGDQNRFL